MMAEKAFKLLECAFSLDNHTSINPICLSCGHVICKKCIPSNGNYKLKCFKCDKINKLNLNECEESLGIKCLFETYFADFLNILHDKYLESFANLRENKARYDEIVNESVETIRSDIDLRVNILKEELDKFRDDANIKLDEIQENILKSKQEFIQKIIHKNEFESKFNELAEIVKKKHEVSLAQFAEYEKNILNLKRFSSERFNIDFQLNYTYSDIKRESFGKIELKHFNKLNTSHGPTFSSILSDTQINDLMNLCNWNDNEKLELVYRASRDGYESNRFHEKCDNVSNTLTIVKSTKGYIFGGFTSANWYQVGDNGHYKVDPKAFIFSLKNKENLPIKIDVLNAQKAIVCNNNWGPVFGNDLHIANNSDSNNNSQSDISHSYRSTKIKGDTSSFLAGSNKFQVLDVEVYKVF